MVLSVILTLFSLIMIFLHDNFFNLKFINPLLVSARLHHASFSFIKPAFFAVLCAFSVKPIQSKTQSFIFLVVIACYSFQHMISTSVTRTYFHRGLNEVNLWFKILKTACLVTFPLIRILSYTLKDFCLIFVMILPCTYGIALYAKKVADDRLYEKIS